MIALSIRQRAALATALSLALLLTGCSRTTTEERRAATVALASMPTLRIADPDPHRARYVRDEWQPHGWADADGDGCNTRKEVLIAESSTPPSVNPDGCKLSGGKWRDRFSPFQTSFDGDLQIDHLVALADAHRSGGWQWPAEKKIAFTNNLDDPDELNALENDENQDKSDKGPDQWMPSSQAARCNYVRAYASVKSKWNLTVTKAQWQALAAQWVKCK